MASSATWRSPELSMRKQKRPILVTLLALAQMIVGGLLLACGALDMVANVAGSSSATVTLNVRGQPTTRTYDTREEMIKEAPGYKLFLLGGAVLSLMLHVTMIAAAVGLLRLRVWGWLLSLAWTLLRLAYQLLTAAYLWFVAMPAANRMVRVVPHDDNGVCSSMVNGNTFYHLFWALFSTGFALYPFLVLVLLALPPVWRVFVARGAGDWDDPETSGRSRSRRDST
jgi:hypothetical protein